MAKDTAYYLWSPVSDGGDSMTVRTPNGGERNVISKRNIHPVGEKVTQDSFDGLDDATWEEWINVGAVRTYPYPEMPANSDESPITFLQRKINEAATSEEERMVALVQGATSTDEAMANAVANAETTDETTTNETDEERAAREAADAENAKKSGFFGR